MIKLNENEMFGYSLLKTYLIKKDFEGYSNNINKLNLSYENEESLRYYIANLNLYDKQKLRACLNSKFESNENAHIYYLIARTRTTTKKNHIEKIEKIYNKLNKIQSIKLLL